jgi:hypothetical protein
LSPHHGQFSKLSGLENFFDTKNHVISCTLIIKNDYERNFG